MKKIALVIAHEGYQPIEYGEPKNLLEQQGFTVLTVSDMLGTARASDGSIAAVDETLEQFNTDHADALFYIGGPGALTYLDTQESHELLKQWRDTGKPFGAICISPRILAKAGVLSGKEATGWDGDEQLAGVFDEHSVTYVRQPVVSDGNTITASGPDAALAFAQAIADLLS